MGFYAFARDYKQFLNLFSPVAQIPYFAATLGR